MTRVGSSKPGEIVSRARSHTPAKTACWRKTSNDNPLPSKKSTPPQPLPSGPTRVSATMRSGCSVLVTGGLLLLAELEVLAAGDDELLLGFAFLALKPKGHLLGGLGLHHNNKNGGGA